MKERVQTLTLSGETQEMAKNPLNETSIGSKELRFNVGLGKKSGSMITLAQVEKLILA